MEEEKIYETMIKILGKKTKKRVTVKESNRERFQKKLEVDINRP